MRVAFDTYIAFFERLEKKFKENEFPSQAKIPTEVKSFWSQKLITDQGIKALCTQEKFQAESLYFYKLWRTAENGPFVSVKDISLAKALYYIGVRPESSKEYEDANWQKRSRILLERFIKDHDLPNTNDSKEDIEFQDEKVAIEEGKKTIESFFSAINSQEYDIAWRFLSPNFMSDKWDSISAFKSDFNTNSKKVSITNFHFFNARAGLDWMECFVYFENAIDAFEKVSFAEAIAFLNQNCYPNTARRLSSDEIDLLINHYRVDINPEELGVNDDVWNKFFFSKYTSTGVYLHKFALERTGNDLLIYLADEVKGVNSKSENTI